MSSNNWWAKKLGTPEPQAAPRYVAPQPATYAQPSQPQYPPTQQVSPPAPRCPGCGSGNYGGTAETRARCYDCGYPIQQSGSGMGRGIIGQGEASGPAQPARQIQTGGWNPNTIIGKIE